MILKFREIAAKQLAELHAIAWLEENQFVFDPPKNDDDINKPCPKPALRIRESKESLDGFHEMFHDVTLELAESYWRPPEEVVLGLNFFGYKEEPIPRRLVNEILDAVGRFADFREAKKPTKAGEKSADLLARITTVKVAGAAKFVAKDHLKEANIGWTDDNFKKLFLEKVEEDVPDAVIAVHHLERASKDAPIIAELGARAEIKLTHFLGLLEAQSKGQEGALAVDGSANIAYIIGIDGKFWAVNALWDSDDRYWYVVVYSVGRPDGWSAGRQVLSRDSL